MIKSLRLWRRRQILPGFGLTLGFTLLYLSLVVLLPLSAAFLKASGLGWEAFFRAVTAPRVVASYGVSLRTAATAAAVNTVLGTVVAWVLVRYRFPAKRLLDAMVDLPFALPTSVAGIALASIYGPNGLLGAPLLHVFGWKIAYTEVGIFVALTFIGLPFVVRTLEPVLLDFDPEYEEAAASLGASRWRTMLSVIGPELVPPALTGFALAFARALGEFGSVVFIAGNMPMKTEIVPLLIVTKLEQYDYRGATAVAIVMLVLSFLLLLVINLLQRWSARWVAH
ncbi:MAG: sulfate ABC transporter permease subunit CysT [Verrucomicrobia bacterium]|nr:sulfate ABC transporter permease subunit CysT [Verrucomicrobiota bacterium]